MDTITIIFILFVLVILIAMGLVYYRYRKKIKDKSERVVKQKSGSKNYLDFIYKFYQKIPILNKYFQKQKKRITMIYPADEISIRKKVTSILLKNTLIVIGGVIVAIAVGRSDMFYMMVILMITFLAVSYSANSGYEKVREKILEQFRDYLGDIQHAYHDKGIITSALRATLDKVPYELGLHINNIYNIVCSPNMKYEIDRYIGREPNKYILTFLSLCSSVKEYGDKKINGKSVFITNLNYLKSSVGNEIANRRENKFAFRGYIGMCLFPIMIIKPYEAWAKMNMDSISKYYDGVYGIIAVGIIFLITIASYSMINSLKEMDMKNKLKEDSIFARIASLPFVAPVLNRIINKHYTRYVRYNDALLKMGDHTGPKAFLLKRILYAVVTTVTVIGVFGVSTVRERQESLGKYVESFENAIMPSDAYRKQVYEIVEDYIAAYKDVTIGVDDLKNDILKTTNIKNITHANLMAEGIVKSITGYQNAYFKWYNILIAYGLGILMYMIPVVFLKFQSEFINLRKKEEIVQFQSIILMLMYTDGTNVPTLLEWMERFSYCFRADIINCRLNLSNGQQQALKKMKEECHYKPFENLIDNLLSVDRVGVARAFDELQGDREFNEKEREQLTHFNINIRASRARMFAFAPFMATILLYLIVPLVMFGFDMLQSFEGLI